MPLTEQQIKERLKVQAKKAVIQRAILHEDRLRFHSEITLNEHRWGNPAGQHFFSWVEGLLPADQFRLWFSLVRYPIKTIQDVNKIFDGISKVFDGQNPVYKSEFTNPDLSDDFDAYMEDYHNKWPVFALETLRLAVNSVIVVDVPVMQKTSRPEPYAYRVDIRNLMDYTSVDNTLTDVIFRTDKTHFVVIDDASYRLFRHDENGDIQKAVLEAESPHDLGECPASWFWAESISPNDPDVKQSPLSSHLEELNWLLFYLIAKNTADLHASFPITWSYDVPCDYTEERPYSEGANLQAMFYKCDGGFLRDPHRSHWLMNNDGPVPCPACSKRRITGPGTNIRVPMPASDGIVNEKPLGAPAGHIERDIDSLKYVVEEIKRRRADLYQDITGYGGEPTNDQAVNEKQIIAAFEARTAILRDLKRNFEKIRIWIDSTIAKLRYGKQFVGITYDMGTDFYLYDANMILEMYQAAREKELDNSLLDILLDQYHATRYRNNPDALLRYKIEKELKPYRHISNSKALGLWEKKIISDQELQIILNFPTFVSRFEREQSSLLEFGKNLMWKERIEAIRTIINSYTNAINREQQTIGAGNPGAAA